MNVWLGRQRCVQHDPVAAPRRVYNIEVEGAHTYFVGNGDGVLAHNKCDAWEYVKVYASEIGRGLAQGGANIVNGVQDVAVHIYNGFTWIPNGVAFASSPIFGIDRSEVAFIPRISSPDWSRGLFMTESGDSYSWNDTHSWSKAIGAQGAIDLLTLDASLPRVGQNLVHCTKLETAGIINAERILKAKGGIYALNNPSSWEKLNMARAFINHADGRIPIPSNLRGLFRPMPVIGPISFWESFNGAYVARYSSINLATGATFISESFNFAHATGRTIDLLLGRLIDGCVVFGVLWNGISDNSQ